MYKHGAYDVLSLFHIMHSLFIFGQDPLCCLYTTNTNCIFDSNDPLCLPSVGCNILFRIPKKIKWKLVKLINRESAGEQCS